MKYLLYVLLILCSSSVLEGQGYEKFVNVQKVNIAILDRRPVLLPNESVLIRTRQFDLIDDQGDLVFKTTANWSADLVDTLGGEVHVIGTNVSRSGMVNFQNLRENRYGLDGRLISSENLRIDTIATDSTLRETLPTQIVLHDDGSGSILGSHFYRGENIESKDSMFYYFLSEERQVVHKAKYSFDTELRVLKAHGLSDKSLAAIIDLDTTESSRVINYGKAYVAKIAVDGSLTVLDTTASSNGFRIGSQLLENDRVLVVNRLTDDELSFSIYDFSSEILVSRQIIANGTKLTPTHARRLNNGDIAVLGRVFARVDPDFPKLHLELRVFSADLSLKYVKKFYLDWTSLESKGMLEMPNGDLLILADIQNFNAFTFVARVTPDGITYPNSIGGRLTRAGEICASGTDEGLADWWLRIEPTVPGRDTFYTYTDGDGNFNMRIDTGEYILRPVPPNAYWGECPPQRFFIERGLDTLILAPTAPVDYDCSLLTVGINSGALLDRCEENTFVATYQNRGSLASEPALLRVTVDSLFTPESSVPNWDRRNGDTLFYNLPPVAVWELGRIVINGVLDCEEVAPFQTHCTDAHVFPDSLCTPPGINWDGSSIEVNGTCTGDSVIFEIRNVTPNPMIEEQQFVIVEDLILHLQDTFKLGGGKSKRLSVPANGSAFTLLADQSEGHPGNSNPSVSVEGCGAMPDVVVSRGIIGQYPKDDGDPFVDISCVQNDGSDLGGRRRPGALDTSGGTGKSFSDTGSPFSLDVSPTGFGGENLIDTSTALTYRLNFTNDGEESIIRLLFVDTLSGKLDLTSVVPGPSSLPYRFTSTITGILRFEMTDVEVVPGETVFLSFRVEQGRNAEPGSVIRNRAGVTYRGKAFLASNEVVLKVRKPVRYGSTFSKSCVASIDDLPDYFRSYDTITRPAYDSITISLDQPVTAYAVRIDTTVIRGDSVLGFRVLSDVVLMDSLRTDSGCDSLITFVVEVATANRNAGTTRTLALYPNPAGDFAVLRLPVVAGEGEVLLTDVLGRNYSITASATGDGLLLDLRRLPGGTYVVSLSAGDRRWVSRLVVR